MLPNLFILTAQGAVVFEAQWETPELSRAVCDEFLAEADGAVSAVGPHVHVHIKRGSLRFLSVLRDETAPLAVLETLSRLHLTLSDYVTPLSADRLRQAFSTVALVVDEFVDGGFPATTERAQIHALVHKPSLTRSLKATLTGEGTVSSVLPVTSTSATPWRIPSEGDDAGETRFDFIESLNAIIDASSGRVLTSNVNGEVLCRSSLRGMPECTLVLRNSSVMNLAATQLHRCARIRAWKEERTLQFLPPDGQFTLLRYRAEGGTNLPFALKVRSLDFATGDIDIALVPKFDVQKHEPKNVTLSFPVPVGTRSAALQVTDGKAQLDVLQNRVVWTLGTLTSVSKSGMSYSASREARLQGNLAICVPNQQNEQCTRISLTFGLSRFSATNLAVQSMHVSGHTRRKTKQMVRYTTRNGNFEFRYTPLSSVF
ncbi:MAG: hypothetical protein MHM6MM_005261 [Cercozoa sp. M6MM]